MRLIEKKCPNCGVALGFADSDKSCECKNCHKSYEIVRDSNNILDYNLMAVDKKINPLLVLIITILGLGLLALLIYIVMNLGS